MFFYFSEALTGSVRTCRAALRPRTQAKSLPCVRGGARRAEGLWVPRPVQSPTACGGAPFTQGGLWQGLFQFLSPVPPVAVLAPLGGSCRRSRLRGVPSKPLHHRCIPSPTQCTHWATSPVGGGLDTTSADGGDEAPVQKTFPHSPPFLWTKKRRTSRSGAFHISITRSRTYRGQRPLRRTGLFWCRRAAPPPDGTRRRSPRRRPPGGRQG